MTLANGQSMIMTLVASLPLMLRRLGMDIGWIVQMAGHVQSVAAIIFAILNGALTAERKWIERYQIDII